MRTFSALYRGTEIGGGGDGVDHIRREMVSSIIDYRPGTRGTCAILPLDNLAHIVLEHQIRERAILTELRGWRINSTRHCRRINGDDLAHGSSAFTVRAAARHGIGDIEGAGRGARTDGQHSVRLGGIVIILAVPCIGAGSAGGRHGETVAGTGFVVRQGGGKRGRGVYNDRDGHRITDTVLRTLAHVVSIGAGLVRGGHNVRLRSAVLGPIKI